VIYLIRIIYLILSFWTLLKFFKRRKVSREYVIFLTYLFFAFITEFTLTITSILGIRNLWIISAFTFIEITCLSSYLGMLLYKRFLKFLILFMFFVLIVIGFSEIALRSFNDSLTILTYTESLVFIFFSSLYLIQEFNNISKSIGQNPHFWITSGLLFYFSCFMLYSGTFELMRTSEFKISLSGIYAMVMQFSSIILTAYFLKAVSIQNGK
jgi:hypothetical protein